MKSLTIEITDMCPLYCRHCSTYGAWDRDNITMDVDEIIDYVGKFDYLNPVRLSGGEPFMHPDIIKILDILHRKNKEIEILTSGIYRDMNVYSSIPDEYIDVCSNRVNKINFSLHGPKDVHEEVTGFVGAFDYLNQTIDKVIKKEIDFSFGFVVLNTNVVYLEEAVKYIAQKKQMREYCDPPLFLLRYVKQGTVQYIGEKSRNLAVSSDAILNLIDHSQKLSKKYDVSIIPTCSILEKGCSAGKGKKVVSIYGDIHDRSALKWNYVPVKDGVACKDRH